MWIMTFSTTKLFKQTNTHLLVCCCVYLYGQLLVPLAFQSHGTIVREYVFYVFLKIQKNATFYVFLLKCCVKKRKKRRKRCPSFHSSPL